MTPTCTTLLDVWHKALDQDPNDFATRGLMADWYADQGDTAAESCLRWQARGRKRPCKAREASPGGLVQWYDEDSGAERDTPSTLPAALWQGLRGGKTFRVPLGRYGPLVLVEYHSRRAAEDALLTAWRALAALGQAPC